MSTADEIRAERRVTRTTFHLIEAGEATPQQLDIDSAVFELDRALAHVPSTTAHYAVEDLRLAIRRYRSAPPIKTADA
jgi:hypothetical protein